MRNGVHKKDRWRVRGKGILQREVKRMAKAFLIKAEQAGPRDPFMNALGLALGGLKRRGLQIPAFDQHMDGRPRKGKELGDIANLEQGWQGRLGNSVIICYHILQWLGFEKGVRRVSALLERGVEQS